MPSLLEAACSELALSPRTYVKPRVTEPRGSDTNSQEDRNNVEASSLIKLYLPGMSTSCLLQLTDSEERRRKAEDATSPKGQRGSKRLKFSQAWLQGELLWGSGLVLAAWLVSSGSVRSRRVLELGSGLGTGGLVAATLGAQEVVVSDRPGPVLDKLQRNIRLNIVAHREHELPLRAWSLDWAAAQPTEGEAPVFDVILGADILYDRSSLPSLVLALQNHLAPGGTRLSTIFVKNILSGSVTRGVHIHLHEQRRRGLAAALGLPEAGLGQTVSVHQLITADDFGCDLVRAFAIHVRNSVEQPTTNRGYDIGFVFPPEGMTCRGYDNATVSVRFPDGAGLLRNNYTLEVDVSNPGYVPNSTTWSFITRVRNEEGEKIVDANRTLEGFGLVELLPMRQVAR
ncbi:mettl21a [Symbiodinium necroappetens]|uniref:Mettl21a protein n=1 Tax=Symbiodinium necroappetens TaxID=1628268 RepID=A0A813A4M1_9DINO|nr:mettl21a [Symbiodinium necroappetens]